MNFNENFDQAKNFFDRAAVLTGNALESARLYIEKARIKGRLSSLYQDLGRADYENNYDESDRIKSDIKDCLKQLDEIDKLIKNKTTAE